MGFTDVWGSPYPYSIYMVAPEEVIPATGWSYAAWLGQLVQNPTMDGREVSKNIVSTYIVDDAVLTQRASSSEIADIESGSTLSAVESALVPNVISTMNQFISTIATAHQTWVAQAREYAPSYY